MPNTPPALIANGNIFPSRFVTPTTSTDHRGQQATANAPIIGITRDETNRPPIVDPAITNPGYHAIAGEPIRLIGDGEIGYIEAGAAITAGDRLKSDGDGKGIPIATTGNVLQQVGAIAQESAAGDGIKIRVQCQIGAEWAAT